MEGRLKLQQLKTQSNFSQVPPPCWNYELLDSLFSIKLQLFALLPLLTWKQKTKNKLCFENALNWHIID